MTQDKQDPASTDRIVKPEEEDPPVPLSVEVRALLERAHGQPMAFGAILRSFPRRTHAMLLVFLSFPMCLPVTVPLGSLVAFVAFFLFWGKPPWIPKRLREKEITYTRLESVSQRLLRTLARLEHLLHPRWEMLSGNAYAIRMHAATIFVLALIVIVPLPILFANMAAAIPIFLISLGLLERDGYFIVAGYASVAAITLPFYGALAFLGTEAVEHFMHLGS